MESFKTFHINTFKELKTKEKEMNTMHHQHISLQLGQLWSGSLSVCSMPQDDYRFEPGKAFFGDSI